MGTDAPIEMVLLIVFCLFGIATTTKGSALENGGKNCWDGCNKQQGLCNWCGAEGWCCRQGWWDNGNGCDGTFGGSGHHHCVLKPSGDTCAKIPSWMKSDLANRIINGKTAPSPIPWQVHLRQGSPTDFTRVCGGTIIDAKTILTAAHCYANKDLNSANFFVTAGIVDRINGAGQNAFVEKIILHESYIQKNPISPSNDIAILKLKTPLAFNDKVQQACLPDASFIPTGKAVASGWGWTRPDAAETLIGDDRFPKDLQWVAMPVVTNDKCDQAPFKWDAGRITANMICAGDADGGEDTCKGDSGGPLVIPKSSTDDTAVVIGITSFGDLLCGKQGFPGVYTYVTRYLNWIKPKMEN